MIKKYVQYGCGHSAPVEWENYDISPTLRIQKTPLIGSLLKNKLNTTFPLNVRFGDILSGLPVLNDSCDGLYCSHTLEHLSLKDFRKALVNSLKILKKGGIFRCIVPDLECSARLYVDSLNKNDNQASIKFMNDTMLGLLERPYGFKGFISSFFGNRHHLWMWDQKSLSEELRKAGFSQIRLCKFNDCEDQMFNLVEDIGRFENAVAIECRK